MFHRRKFGDGPRSTTPYGRHLSGAILGPSRSKAGDGGFTAGDAAGSILARFCERLGLMPLGYSDEEFERLQREVMPRRGLRVSLLGSDGWRAHSRRGRTVLSAGCRALTPPLVAVAGSPD